MQNLISTAMGLTGWMQEPQSHNHMSDELYRAVLSGDFGAVQRLPEYNKCTTAPNNNNILHLLARAGDSSANAVKHVLGEKPNLAFMKNGDGETPLVIASRKGYSEVARQLIVASVGNDMKLDAVLEAVRFNRSDVVEMFLEQIPELFEKESHRSQNLKPGQLVNVLVSALLIEKKKKKIYVESPLYLAVEKEHHDIVNMILSSSCKSIAFHGPEEDLTALHAAAIRNSPVINGHLDVMQEIIEQCPQSWEMVTIKEKNILHLAIENEQKQGLEWILGCCWSSELINQKDVDGNTPLHLYVSTKSLESCSLLNHPYGDRNPLNKHGLTPLDLILDTANFTATTPISIRGELERAGARPGLWRINHESETSHVDESDDGDENANTYMVVATLILTVAFAAGITVPGGYDTTKGNEGMAILGKKAAFIIFVVSNSMAMLLSICVVHMQLRSRDKGLISRKLPAIWFNSLNKLSFLRDTSKMYITYAMAWLVVAFISGLFAIMPVLALKIYILVMGSLFFLPLAEYTVYSFLEALEHAIRL